MNDCVFCKIVNGILPAEIIYQDQEIIAFDDNLPRAPTHKLIIPRKHIATLNDLTAADKDLISNMFLVAKQLAFDLKIAESGYRIVINTNREGGQLVYHLHLHLLGGIHLGKHMVVL